MVRKVVTCGIAATSIRRAAIAFLVGDSGTVVVGVTRQTWPGSLPDGISDVAVPDRAPAARSTSSLVTRPPGPVPTRRARSTPRSFASLRTAGVVATAVAPSAPATSNVASGAPTASVSPAPTWSFEIVPADGAGTSTVALAVSISTKG